MCWAHAESSDTLHKVGNMPGMQAVPKVLALKFGDLKELRLLPQKTFSAA